MEKLENVGSVDTEVKIEYTDTELFPVIGIKKNGVGDWSLVSLQGSKTMWSRFGEFLAMLLGQDKFYFQEYDDDSSHTFEVDMEPYDEKVTEINQEDMDKDIVTFSEVANSI